MSDRYTSTVTAPGQIVLGAISGLVILIGVLAFVPSLWFLGVLGLVLAAAAGYYLAPVSLSVTPQRVEIGQGRGDKNPTSLHSSEIADGAAAELTWAQCFGLGPRTEPGSTRLAVRQGPALRLTLTDGREVLVSTPDPQAALAVLQATPRPV